MKFQQSDFQGDTVTRLSVIIQTKMGNPPLTLFRDMGESQKKKFNRLLKMKWFVLILNHMVKLTRARPIVH